MKIFGFNVDEKTTAELNILDHMIGTIADIVESPFGILLEDISIAGEETKLIDKTFIPMSEITKMHIFKKESGRVYYELPESAKSEERHNDK